MKKYLFYIIFVSVLLVPSMSFAMGLIPSQGKEIKYLRGIEPGFVYMQVGSAETFELTGVYMDGTDFSFKADLVEWSVSRPIGKISRDGIFEATKAGTTEIIARKNGRIFPLTITVTDEITHIKPCVPTGLQVTNITTNSAIADWDDCPNPSGNEIYYVLSIGTDKDASDGGVPWRVKKPHKITWYIPIPQRLKSDTTYYIKLRAFNRYGLSENCKPVAFTTLKE